MLVARNNLIIERVPTGIGFKLLERRTRSFRTIVLRGRYQSAGRHSYWLWKLSQKLVKITNIDRADTEKHFLDEFIIRKHSNIA